MKMQCIKAVEVSLQSNITKKNRSVTITITYLTVFKMLSNIACLFVTLHTAYNKSTTVEIALYTGWYTHKSNRCVC